MSDQRVSRRQFAGALSAAAVQVAGVTRVEATPAGGRERQIAEPRADAVDRALHFLRSRDRQADGSFSRRAPVGVAALVATALLRHGRPADDALVAELLRYLTASVRPDGGIYSPDGTLGNYETCLAVECLVHAAVDERYAPLLDAAVVYLRDQQWGETNGTVASDGAYGGAGYGKRNRPDLSNTAFYIEALIASGCSAGDPALQKALLFVSRCQNFESEHNTTPFAPQNPDGGFYYTCAAGGSSPAGTADSGGLCSYASMTCSGLKSMLHAGLGPDEPRVVAAVAWLRKHYDLEANAGLGSAGLYYYYHAFARCMNALGCWSFEDSNGVSHDWRSELTAQLLRRQQLDGSWVNENDRWMEGEPSLVTAYALTALSYC
jgi:squalene-hopene/tetraprenyl-beta-curcumene cyclase